MFLSCLEENVKKKIQFGTAGYRPFHSVDSLNQLLDGNQEKYQLCLSFQEHMSIQKYIQQCEQDKSCEEMNDHVVALIGQSIALTLENYPEVDRVIVNYDVRLKGKEYSLILIQALSCLVKKGRLKEIVLLEEYVSTPELSYLMLSEYPTAWGIHLTASHNPFWFCGLKVEYCLGKVAPLSITQMIEENYQKCYQNLSLNGGYDLFEAIYSVKKQETFFSNYLEYVEKELKVLFPWFSFQCLGETLKKSQQSIVIDLNWGEGIYFWKKIRDLMGFEEGNPFFVLKNTQLSGDPFGSFCFQKPEPSYATLVGRYPVETGPDYVISHDPDADRFTVLQKQEDQADYTELSADKWALLLIGKLVSKVKEGQFFGKNVSISTTMASCSVAIRYALVYQSLFKQKGVNLRCVDSLPVGFKWFASTPKTSQTKEGEDLLYRQSEDDFHFVYEESGGVSTRLYEKDGLLGGIMSLCMIAESKDLIQQEQLLREEIPEKVHYSKVSFSYAIEEVDSLDYLVQWVRDEILHLSYKKGHFWKMWQTLLKDRGYEIVSLFYQEGVRIELAGEHETAWLTWRLSGTEPKMRIYMQSMISENPEDLCFLQTTVEYFRDKIVHFLRSYFSQPKLEGEGH